MQTWIIEHHHRHGTDLLIFKSHASTEAQLPPLKEIMATLGADYEPDPATDEEWATLHLVDERGGLPIIESKQAEPLPLVDRVELFTTEELEAIRTAINSRMIELHKGGRQTVPSEAAESKALSLIGREANIELMKRRGL